MGRGRAKAIQTKIARQLKYDGGGTDLNRLRNELRATGSAQNDLEVDGGAQPASTDESDGISA